jgi:hypothetical protein
MQSQPVGHVLLEPSSSAEFRVALHGIRKSHVPSAGYSSANGVTNGS